MESLAQKTAALLEAQLRSKGLASAPSSEGKARAVRNHGLHAMKRRKANAPTPKSPLATAFKAVGM